MAPIFLWAHDYNMGQTTLHSGSGWLQYVFVNQFLIRVHSTDDLLSQYYKNNTTFVFIVLFFV